MGQACCVGSVSSSKVQSVPYLKVVKPHCHCNQLAIGEALKERQDDWEDVEEGQGGHSPSREVVRSPQGPGSAVDEPGIGHSDC